MKRAQERKKEKEKKTGKEKIWQEKCSLVKYETGEIVVDGYLGVNLHPHTIIFK